MVIQRWQSVLLLIAALCMAAVCFLPLANSGTDLIMPGDLAVFLTINIASAVLLFAAIFMFKNMPRQRLVTLLSIVLIIISAGTGLTSAYVGYDDVSPAICSCVLMLVALVSSIWAYRRIGADQKKLRAADRLR